MQTFIYTKHFANNSESSESPPNPLFNARFETQVLKDNFLASNPKSTTDFLWILRKLLNLSGLFIDIHKIYINSTNLRVLWWGFSESTWHTAYKFLLLLVAAMAPNDYRIKSEQTAVKSL